MRWPDGFCCPVCECPEGWRIASGAWMCRDCARKTSVTAGTIFHRTRSPLSLWFAATWFVCSQKNGVSALGLQRVLGFASYETAWAWLHKLRRAMVSPDRDLLDGLVEVDETYFGARSSGTDGRGTAKTPIVIGRRDPAQGVRPGPSGPAPRRQRPVATRLRARQRGQGRHGAHRRLRRLPAPRPPRATRHAPISVITSGEQAHVVLPGVHRVASLLKRWLTGTLHYSISDKHLDYYLDEFTFRFNRRTSRSRGLLFYRILDRTRPARSLRSGRRRTRTSRRCPGVVHRQGRRGPGRVVVLLVVSAGGLVGDLVEQDLAVAARESVLHHVHGHVHVGRPRRRRPWRRRSWSRTRSCSRWHRGTASSW